MKTIWRILVKSRIKTLDGKVIWVNQPHIMEDFYGPYTIPEHLLHELESEETVDVEFWKDLEFVDCARRSAPMNEVLSILERDGKVRIKLPRGEDVTATKYIRPLNKRYDDFLLDDNTTVAERYSTTSMSFAVFGYWR